MKLKMEFKKKFIGLVLIIFGCVFTAGSASAASRDFSFREFSLSQYPVNQSLSQEELIDQIQGFAYKTSQEISRCSESGSSGSNTQTIFCTKIHEADHIRLAYLYSISAASDFKEVGLESLIYSDKNVEYDEVTAAPVGDEPYFVESGFGHKSESNTSIFDNQPILNQDLAKKSADYHDGYLRAVNYSLKQCENNVRNTNSFVSRKLAINGLIAADKNRQKVEQCSADIADNPSDYCRCSLATRWNELKRPFNYDGVDYNNQVAVCAQTISSSINVFSEATDQEKTDVLTKFIDESENRAKQALKDAKKDYQEIDCLVLEQVLAQFSNRDRIKKLLSKATTQKWLPFNKYEQKYFKLTESQKNQADQTNMTLPISECGYRGFDTIKCMTVRAGAESFDIGWGFLFDPTLLLQIRISNLAFSNLKPFWIQFRNIANIILVLSFLVIVISQMTGYKKNSLGLKVILPRLIIAIIVINLSFLLAKLLIDVSNIFGDAIDGLFKAILMPFKVNEPGLASIIGAFFLGATSAVAGGYVAFGNITWLLVVIVVALAVISLLLVFALLTMRNLFIIISIIIAPLLISFSILPGTRKFFDYWTKMIPAMFLMYPLAILLKSFGDMIGTILYSSGNPAMMLASFGFMVIPYFILPKLLISATKKIPIFGNNASVVSNFAQKQKDKVLNSNTYQNAKYTHQQWLKKALISDKNIIGRSRNKIRNKINPKARLLDYAQNYDYGEFRKKIDEQIKQFGGNDAFASVVVKKITGDYKDEQELYKNLNKDEITKLKSYPVNNPESILAAVEFAAESGDLTKKQLSKIFTSDDSDDPTVFGDKLAVDKFGDRKILLDSLNRIEGKLNIESDWVNASFVNNLKTGRRNPIGALDYLLSLNRPATTKLKDKFKNNDQNSKVFIEYMDFFYQRFDKCTDPDLKQDYQDLYETKLAQITNEDVKTRVIREVEH